MNLKYFKTFNTHQNASLPFGCKAFGVGVTDSKINSWVSSWSSYANDINVILVLAGSKTAEVKGISAAGATVESRRFTALADAEFFLKGPSSSFKWPLPPLIAGVSPALISYVSSKLLNLNPMVFGIGLYEVPSYPFIPIEVPYQGPANCVSTGQAMSMARVEDLWEKGLSMGRQLEKPLVLSECVPGGTTTALAVLLGLGISAGDWVSGSIRIPPIELKKTLVECGLRRAGVGPHSLPKSLLAAIGDPFQPFATGLLIGARQSGLPVLLGGGSQMLAVLALALSSIDLKLRNKFLDEVVVGTTAWLADESTSHLHSQSSFFKLISLMGDFYGIDIWGVSSGLRFKSSSRKVLYDYELGYIKEGVGAGALSLLAQVNGISCNDLIDECEVAVDQLNNHDSQ